MLLCRRLLPRVHTPIRVYAQQVIGSQIHGKALSRSIPANATVQNALPEAADSASNRQVRAAMAMLSATNYDESILDKRRIHSLLVLLRRLGALSELSASNVSRLVKHVVNNPDVDPYDARITDVLLPLFHQPLRQHSVPKGVKSMSYRPPSDVFTAFGLVHKLITFHRDRDALHLFQTLTETYQIPVEAFAETYHTSPKDKNFAFIIRSTLIRACFHWGWYHRALDIVTTAIMTQDSTDAAVTELALSTLHLALHNATHNHFKHCTWLMCHLAKPGNVIIPDGTIRLFYDRAMHVKDGPSAEFFYKYTQFRRTIRRVKYPLPRGRSLTWLMDYLATTSRNVHLARTLAKQVVDEMEPIPLQDRARFVTLAASHGFASSARTLWGRYSVGRDRDMVLGNASLMLRMVSIFSKLINRTKDEIEDSTTSQDKDDGRITVSSLDERQKQLDDLIQFVERVVRDFRTSKGSLEKISHFDLSSLARAYITLGRVSDGLDMLKVLLGRYEIPDIYDINIAISAIAEFHPRRAAGIMKKMVARGIRPDAVTFGTIIHHAILHGELRLAGYLIGRAQELGCEELSAKTTASLLRASVNVEGTPTSLLKENLQRAWDIIQSGDVSTVVHKPNTGKYCIFASLRLDDPVMAFKFWETLVKGKTEWGDRKQAFQRRLIANMIQRHCQKETLSRDCGRQMLAQLKERRVL